MKSSGQTLVMFVILIPIIIMFGAVVIDVGLMYKEDKRLESVTKEVVEKVLESKSTSDAVEIYEKNDIKTDGMKVIITDKVNVVNEYEIDSIFGQILGFDTYQIRVNMTGYYDNDKLVFEE